MVKFILGEDRHIKFRIHSTNNKKFEIRQASWQLLRYGNEELFGDCIIRAEDDGNYLDVKLKPEGVGNYTLMLTYMVADEIIKNAVEVQVV